MSYASAFSLNRGSEKLSFYSIDEFDREIFLRQIVQKRTKRIILFLNPFFDEKERFQRFQYSLIDSLRKENDIIFFDYYGTGESTGDSGKFDLELSISHIGILIKKIQKEYPEKEVTLLGIRMGADLAILISQKYNINILILFDPVIKGSRYWYEIELRRKVFLKSNNIKEIGQIRYQNSCYEDFEGFLIHCDTVESLKNTDNSTVVLNNLNILLFKQINSAYQSLQEKFITLNSVKNYLNVGTYPNSIIDSPDDLLFINTIKNFLSHV